MLNINRDSEINLINLMIDHDLISVKDLLAIRKISNKATKPQIECVFELNPNSENSVVDILVKEQDLEIIDLSTIQASSELKNLIPQEFIDKNFIVPFKVDKENLHIAISDSSKLNLIKQLTTISKRNIELHAAKVSQISFLIDQLYPESEKKIKVESELDKVDKTIVDTSQIESSEASWGNTKENKNQETEEKEEDDPENDSDVVKFTTAIISEAIKIGASDIHIEPYRFSSRIRFRLDGMLHEQKHFKKFLHDNFNAVVTRFKIMGKLDIAERRLSQDGAIPFRLNGKTIDLRLSVLPTATNERVVMRVLNKDAANVSLENLNFGKEVLDTLRKAINATQGLILVTGPTGSGKTTTLYSILQEVSKPHLNILTAEDPVEYELDGVAQVQIREDIGFTFASVLRSFLRQDPEVILIGEMRDKETVDMGIKAALTGHLVFSTLHTNDAPSSITRLQNMGTPDYLISSACSLIIAQRLARKNCSDCKVSDEDASTELLKEIGCSETEIASAKVMKGNGCESCKNTGYKGRMGIYEVLKITKTIKEAILKKATTPEIKELAIKEGFVTMHDMGRKMILEGQLNFREYERVLSAT
jgi:type IV pilus assembly protein PilB